MNRRSSSARSCTSATRVWRRTRSLRSSASSLRSRSPLAGSWPVMLKVIVTGGSRGLGLGIVRRLICEGYCAIAVARKMNEQLASTIEEVDRSRTGSLHFVPFDLAAVPEIPNIIKKLRKDIGPIYGLVNNAG